MEENSIHVRKLMKELNKEFVDTFRHAHQYPEVSLKEFKTTEYIRGKLTSWGIEIIDIGIETGVVGLLRGEKENPCIALRADIDALSIVEESTSEYPSLNDGVMHACGHDSHYSSLLGAAHILSLMKDKLKGSVKFIFQPAEENTVGAKKMVELGVLEKPHVDAIFGIHNSPEIPVGFVGIKDGPLMASSDSIKFYIEGKGGHGGIPQRNIDPIVCAASIIQSTQTIVSRNISPIHSAVISICNIQAGDSSINNICPDSCTMYGTVRCFDNNDRDLIASRLEKLTAGITSAYDCSGTITYKKELPVTNNNPELYDLACKVVSYVGAEAVKPIPSTGGEDFSIYSDKEWGNIPGFFYWLGIYNEKKDCVYPWHSSHFKVDENAIAYGVGIYTMTAFAAIEKFD